MTASSHTKFLFDTDFGQDDTAQNAAQKPSGEPAGDDAAALNDDVFDNAAREEDLPPPPPAFSHEELEQAREEGRQQGRDEAMRDMASAIEQRVTEALEAIDAKIAALLDNYANDMEQHSRDAIAIATIMMRKLFPALNMEHAMAEVEHMIIEAMKRTSGSPALIVRVPEDIFEDVESKANQLARERGREGTITILSDAEMTPGDVAVEWGGGGMLRDSAFIWRELDEIIERNLGQSLDDKVQSAQSEQSEPAAEKDTNQDVVNPALVGENDEDPVESPNHDDGEPKE